MNWPDWYFLINRFVNFNRTNLWLLRLQSEQSFVFQRLFIGMRKVKAHSTTRAFPYAELALQKFYFRRF